MKYKKSDDMKKITLLTLLLSLMISLIGFGQPSLSPEFNKIFFIESKFSRPIFIEIPTPSSIEQYEYIKNNPDIIESGLPKAKLIIGKKINDFDKSLLTYLVENDIANIESLIQKTHNTNYGERSEVFNFIFYNKNYSNKIFRDTSHGEISYYIFAGVRKLKEITYQNMYEDAPMGMKRNFYSIVFNYKIVNEIPAIGNENKIYNGKGKIFQDPDDGLWKIEGSFDNLGISLEDNDQYEYLKLMKSKYTPFDFEKNKIELMNKMALIEDSIRIEEEKLKKYNDSIAFSRKYPIKKILQDGSVFFGNFLDSLNHGAGIVKYTNGNKFEGELVNFKKEGKGKITYEDGKSYEGEWKDDKKEGKGKLTFPNLDAFYGDWSNDICQKKGMMIYFKGDIYEGEMIDFRKNGYGKMTYKNGYIYIGNWENDVENGQGKETNRSEQTKEGIFNNGRLKNGIFKYRIEGVLYTDEGEFNSGTLVKGTRTYTLLDCPKCAITQSDVINGTAVGTKRKVNKK